jgi:tRNA threonylcarbamoyladenosine biosynthesis protein TsaB
MPLILHIDTATENASICLSKNTAILGLRESREQKNHASFVQPAIQDLLQESGISLSDLDAVAVSAGPGSYTGLRVGLASAKGICFALGKPLICLGTLQIIAACMREEWLESGNEKDAAPIICPMIDARRMEVFTAQYTLSLSEIREPHALILDEQSFQTELTENILLFGGNGATKLLTKPLHPNARHLIRKHAANHMVNLAVKAYQSAHFADLAYAEPFYVKEFFDAAKKS